MKTDTIPDELNYVASAETALQLMRALNELYFLERFRSHDDKATEFRERGGSLRGVAPKVAEGYACAADALETLAAALRDRAREFDESARWTR